MNDFLIATPFVIGLLHCLEPDHLVAVSSLVKGEGSNKQAINSGVSWGVGHSIPVLSVGLLYILLNLSIGIYMPVSLELPVGIMLIMIGMWRLYTILSSQDHVRKISNLSFLSVGIVHGLAGTVGIVVLLSARQEGIIDQIAFLLLFCTGLMSGMGIMTGLLSHFFKPLTRMQWVRLVVPLASLAYGVFIIYENV